MTNIDNTKGMVFNIQHYAIHDGPGIRTTVFINGCPLRCIWCQNPESQSLQPQLFFNRERCTGCGKCVEACLYNANEIVSGKARINRNLCIGCGTCTEVCPNEARQLMGKEMTVREVFKEVKKDDIFYQNSGGGVTVSGGDPVSQPEFVRNLLKLCKEASMHTAIDTCGCAHWNVLKPILDYVDLVLFDFKNFNSHNHEKQTGVSNELILENARKIYHELSIPMLARLPIIPGFNDSIENIRAAGRFVSEELGPSVKVHLLPYHRLGETKYERLGKTEKIVPIEPPSDDHMQELVHIIESFGLEAHVGG
jgi:pyruvate formate lyase activating enzyme